MAAETQYTANTGIAKITTANTSLTGSGTLGTDIWDVLTGATPGTLIKTVTIKATVTTTQGMIRLFIYDGSTFTRLLKEIDVPPMTLNSSTGTDKSFETTVQLDYKLKSGYKLRVTTQNSETFNVIAEGLDWAYYATSVRPESTNYTANTGLGFITGAVGSGNTALDGSGNPGTTIWAVLTASTSAGMKGCAIDSITIKATGTVTHGMVRIFINDGTAGASHTFLLTEVFINPIVLPAAGTFQSFSHKIVFPNKLQIKAGDIIYATAQNNSESFSVIAEGADWSYPA
jgi:hypothetical protein